MRIAVELKVLGVNVTQIGQTKILTHLAITALALTRVDAQIVAITSGQIVGKIDAQTVAIIIGIY